MSLKKPRRREFVEYLEGKNLGGDENFLESAAE
jgi:hypothetical protein